MLFFFFFTTVTNEKMIVSECNSVILFGVVSAERKTSMNTGS